MVVVGTGTQGTRFLNREWPNESGLEAGTEKQEGREANLVPEVSNVRLEEQRGLNE